MKNLTFFTFLLLFCGLFTSCLNETSSAVVEEMEEVVPEEEVTLNIFDLTYYSGTESYELNYAYLRTVPIANGEKYQHTLVFTSEPAIGHDNDLTKEVSSGVVGVTYVSSSESPSGSFSALAEEEATTGNGIVSAGGRPSASFTRSSFNLTDVNYDAGMLDVVIEEGKFRIELDLPGGENGYPISGKYTGPVTMLNLPEYPEVIPADFTGASGMDRSGETFELSNAYLVKIGRVVEGRTTYRLFVTEERADDGSGELTGTTNAMLVYLKTRDGIKSGHYPLYNDGRYSGYFTKQERDISTGSYLCRNMNFDTGAMEDDEPMDNGVAIILVDGDEFKIKFTYQSSRDAEVEVVGEYHGTILEAR